VDRLRAGGGPPRNRPDLWDGGLLKNRNSGRGKALAHTPTRALFGPVGKRGVKYIIHLELQLSLFDCQNINF
jgi:hypothetical protein